MTNCVNKRNQKGFTLTELIIVIVIIGILAAVLIPSLSGYISKAKKSAAEQDAMTIYKEFLVDEDIKAENYSDLAVLNYCVRSGNYYVLIQKGAVVGSVSVSEANAGKGYSIASSTDEESVYMLASSVKETTGETTTIKAKGLDLFSDDVSSSSAEKTVLFISLDDNSTFKTVFTNGTTDKDDEYGTKYTVKVNKVYKAD